MPRLPSGLVMIVPREASQRSSIWSLAPWLRFVALGVVHGDVNGGAQTVVGLELDAGTACWLVLARSV